jgi:gas vesicle protein
MNGTMNGGSGGGSFLMGMLCGAAVGAALGLLLAPKPGAALRTDLKNSADDLSRRAKKMYDNASGTISALADQGAKTFDQVTDAASNMAGNVAGNVGRVADRARTHSSRTDG